MIRSPFRCLKLYATFLALAGAVVVSPVDAPAADHLDGPRLMADPQRLGNLDINDVYVFQGGKSTNTVLILTLSPSAGILGPASFSSSGFYEFKIENTGDATEDLTIRFIFEAPNPNLNGHQSFQYYVFNTAGAVSLTGRGTTGKNNPVPTPFGVGTVRPDLYDDPFFFDLNTFNRFKARALAGDPNAASEYLNRGVQDIPQNFFGGFNVMAIVIEVPSVLLQSSWSNTKIGVWARTLLPDGKQFDRMARPAINTVLIPDDFKDMFNSFIPLQDNPFFVGIAADELTKLFGNPTTALANAQCAAPGHHDLRHVQQGGIPQRPGLGGRRDRHRAGPAQQRRRHDR